MNLHAALLRAGVDPAKARALALADPVELAHVPVGQACALLATQRGWTVESLERPRRTAHPGLPDLRLRRAGLACWVEAKSSKDKLTREQYAWLAAEYAAGQWVCAGGVSELSAWLAAIALGQDEVARSVGWSLVERVKGRGWRK